MFNLDNLEKAFESAAVEYSVQVVEDIDIGCDVECGDDFVGSSEGRIYVYNEIARVKSKEGVIARIAKACNFEEQFENYEYSCDEDSFSVRGHFEHKVWQDIVRIVPIYVA